MITEYFNKIIDFLNKINNVDLFLTAELIRSCKGNIFVCGNGGSAATASHFAQDMNKMCNYRFICLNDNIPSLLAYGNDVGFDQIFILQLSRFIKPDDVVIGFSCSGNSQNVINAVIHAKQQGCVTIGFTGFDGGQLRKLVDANIYVNSNDMQVCEDIHLIMTHTLMKLLK